MYTVYTSNIYVKYAIHWVSWTQTSLFNRVAAPKLWPMMKGILDNYPFLPFLAPFHQASLTDSLLLPSPMFFFVAGWPNEHVRMTKLRTVLGQLVMWVEPLGGVGSFNPPNNEDTLSQEQPSWVGGRSKQMIQIVSPWWWKMILKSMVVFGSRKRW